jgi:hypothetical protein
LGDSLDEDESSSEYGYSSDSDLEGDDETVAGALKGTLMRAVGHHGGSLEKSHSARGLTGEDFWDWLFVLSGGGTFREPPQEEYSERLHKGKVVKVPDLAFVT